MAKADGSFENGDLCILGCVFCQTVFEEAQALGAVIKCPNPDCPYIFSVRRHEPEAEAAPKMIGKPEGGSE